MPTDKESLTGRLREACVEHPAAEIKWPHRLLHEAADEIERMRAEVDRLTAALPYDWDKYKASQESLREHMLLVVSEKQARESAEARLRELRYAVQNVIDGNYLSPRRYRETFGNCPHGVNYYSDCGQCTDDYLQAALAEA